MREVICVTDITRMGGKAVCVAGYNRQFEAIRPLNPGWMPLAEEFLFSFRDSPIRPFSVIEIDKLEYDPQPPHTEDWIIDPTGLRLLESCLVEERAIKVLFKTLFPDIESIFGAKIDRSHGCFVLAGEGVRSLGTIRCKSILDVVYEQISPITWDYRLIFLDQVGMRYRLAVTDLGYRSYLSHLRACGMSPADVAEEIRVALSGAEVFLRIGLARGWEKYPERCYLQITGVYSFPDYLEGGCYADFDPSIGHKVL